MGVVGDVAPGQFSYPHAEVLLEDLGRRRRLLLADADEALDAALELRCGRVVSPVGTGVAALLVEHLHGREVEPIRHRVDQSVERRGPANARRSASGAPATCLGSKYPSRRRSYEPVRLRVVAEGGWLADVACSEARSVVEEGRYDFCRVVRTYHRCSRSVGVACRYRGPRSRDRRNASTTEAQHGVTSPARHAVFAEPHRQPPSGTGPAHGLAVAHDAHVPVGVQVLRGRKSILFGLHATHQADPHDVIVGSCYDACPGNQSRSHAANPTRLEPSVPHTSRVRRGALVNKHWAANPAPKPASALATARRPRAYASASTPSATMCCASRRRRGEAGCADRSTVTPGFPAAT